MDSLRTGLSALSVGERRNYQVSPSVGERKSYVLSPPCMSERRNYQVSSPSLGEQRNYQVSPSLGQPRHYQVPPHVTDGSNYQQERGREHILSEEANGAEDHLNSQPCFHNPPQRNYRDSPNSVELRSYQHSPNSLDHIRTFQDDPPLITNSRSRRTNHLEPDTVLRPNFQVMGESRRPQNALDLDLDLDPPSEGFTSMELRRFGGGGGQPAPRSPGILHYKHRTRNNNNRTKLLEEKNPGSDSCYSRSDNSSTHSDPPPRVPLHLPSRSYDTTSLSSIDTSSSLDLWNVRAMPNVKITRLDKPVYLRPNPNTRSRRPNVFDSLTDELIVRILSFLTTKELIKTARVSRKFYFLSWEPGLWRSINLAGEDRDADRTLSCIFQIIAKNGVNIGATVKSLNLSGCSGLTDRGLALVARRCKLLEQLQLQACTLVTNGGLLDLTSRCAHLEHLDVTGCLLVSGVGAPTPRLPLHYLDLSDCPRLDDTALRLVVDSCPQIQFLFLRRCTQITDSGIKSVASYCLMLRELSVSDCHQLTDASLTELGRLGPSLRYLSLAKCELITDAGLRNLARHCYRLRYLNLRGLSLVTDVSIAWIARSCTRLRSLDLGKCDISDNGLQCLSENTPNLKKLSVKGCTKVTDRGVSTLSYYCKGLQQLNIQEVQGVTAQGCRVVRANCRRCIIEHTNPALSL